MIVEKTNILGVGISAISESVAVDEILKLINSRNRGYISVCTVHTVIECQFSRYMMDAVNNATFAVPDGMPLVWLTKSCSSVLVNRVYGPELMLKLCSKSRQTNINHFFLGGSDGVPEQLSAMLCNKYPDLNVVGTYSPPFRDMSQFEIDCMISKLNETKADIIWVGLGTPKQDLWMHKFRKALTAPVLIGVGAAFDFHTGRIRQAPQIMQKNGVEWFFRFLMEPGRLWKRYLLYNPLFVFLLLKQFLFKPTKIDL